MFKELQNYRNELEPIATCIMKPSLLLCLELKCLEQQMWSPVMP